MSDCDGCLLHGGDRPMIPKGELTTCRERGCHIRYGTFPARPLPPGHSVTLRHDGPTDTAIFEAPYEWLRNFEIDIYARFKAWVAEQHAKEGAPA